MPRDGQGCKWNSHHLLNSMWLPSAAEITEIIIHHLFSPHLGTILSSPFSHISWEGCAIKVFIHFLIYPLLQKKEFNSKGWRERAAAAPKPFLGITWNKRQNLV